MHPALENLRDELLRQRERWILWAPVAIAAGVGVYFGLRAEPPVWLGPTLLLFLFLAALPFRRNRKIILCGLPVLLAVLGFTAAQLRTLSVTTPMLEKKTYPLVIEGRVETVEALPEGYRFTLRVTRYQDEKYPEKDLGKMPGKVRLRLKKGDTPPDAGDDIRVRGILLPLSPPVMPGAYDFQRHAFFAGLGATGFAIGAVEVVTHRGEGYFFARLRRVIGANIQAAMENKDAAAITTALLDGEDKNISKATYDTIRTAGLAHLIAISGLQVALVTGFFFFVFRAALAAIPYIALRYPIKKITAFAALCGAVFYMMLIGNSVSAERSVIMVCVAMTAVMCDRDPLTLRMAAFAATALLIFQPESLFGPSFQLSFAAVVALIAFYEATRNWWIAAQQQGGLRRAGVYVCGSMATTLIATAATAPVALYHFLRTPLLPGLVANLIALPLSSFITMPAAIVGSVLAPVGLGAWPLKVAEWSVLAIMKAAETVSQWPYTVYHIDAWPFSSLVLAAFGGLWICIWQGRFRWWGLLPIGVCLLFSFSAPRADVLASADGKLFAVRGDDGRLLISSARTDKFIRDAWIDREGGAGHAFWPTEKERREGAPAASPALSCDSVACLYSRKGHLVSFIMSRDALQEDCAHADIVISYYFIERRACPGPHLVIDGHALKYNGAHALYFGDDGHVSVRTVFAVRGARPWTGQVSGLLGGIVGPEE